MKIAFGIAFALHAAAAAGVVAFGVPGGSNDPAAAGGEQTIEVDPIASPTIHEDIAPVPELKTAHQEVASRGALEAPHLLARSSSAATAATGDVVPQPQPTQTAPTHFAMVASNVTLSARLGSPTGDVSAPQTIAAGEEVVADSDVTVRARQVGGASPTYPSDARAQGVELGSPLPFEIVVDSSGRVASARALHHAGYGFDEAAMTALRTYRFTPATRAGHVVPVRMRWTVDFRLN